MSTTSHNYRRWVAGVSMAVGGAFAAALIGLSNAPAASADTDPDPFEDLFGTTGFNDWTTSADSFLASSDPTLANQWDAMADAYSTTATTSDVDSIQELVYFFDYNALNPTTLVPTDFFGDLALVADVLLTPSGFDAAIDPIVDMLLNSGV
jgi:hypothetical protein